MTSCNMKCCASTLAATYHRSPPTAALEVSRSILWTILLGLRNSGPSTMETFTISNRTTHDLSVRATLVRWGERGRGIESPLLADVAGERLTGGESAFAMTVGGALDIRLDQRISIRPIQVDYLLTRLGSKTALNGYETFSQNNLRYGAGIVFGLGSTQ
jgi:hypothetical protein